MMLGYLFLMSNMGRAAFATADDHKSVWSK